MPVGDSYGALSAKLSARVFFKLLGTPDLHTHLRLRPMIRFLKKYLPEFDGDRIDIVEAGCAAGVNAFEIAKICRKTGKIIAYTGVDKDGDAVAKAAGLARHGVFGGEYSFHSNDAVLFLEKFKGPKADIILLIDILEHVELAEDLLKAASGCLKPGGLFIVSVPTPLYPKVFGRAFHAAIGHAVEGYSIGMLDELFVNGLHCRKAAYSYNTGLFANIGCYLYYNLCSSKNKYFNYIKTVVLYPFKFLDIYNSPKVSCALFAVYKK